MKGSQPVLDAAWAASCVEQLQALGFTEHEARAYVTLLEANPRTAYQVSKASGLPRANAYSVFESLTKKMAVQPVSENPARYVPVEPQVLLGRIAGQTQAKCDRLVEELAAVKRVERTEYVWIVEGEANVHARLEWMLERARRHVWIKAPMHLLERHLETLRDVAAREVEILMILFGDAAQVERFRLGPTVRAYLHEGNGIVVGLAGHMITLTTDFQEALVASAASGGHGGYTRSGPVVNMADIMIRHEVYVAEIFQRFGPMMEEAFGPALVELRRKYLPADQIEALEKVLAAAQVARLPGAGGAP